MLTACNRACYGKAKQKILQPVGLLRLYMLLIINEKRNYILFYYELDSFKEKKKLKKLKKLKLKKFGVIKQNSY